MIIFAYHQVLLATVGNAVVTSAFVYIRWSTTNCNNNKQMCKSTSVSVGRENSVSNATFKAPGRTLSASSHVVGSYYVQQGSWSILSNVYIQVLQSHLYFHYCHLVQMVAADYVHYIQGVLSFFVGLSWTDIPGNARVIYCFTITMFAATVNRRLPYKKNPLCVTENLIYTLWEVSV